MSLLPLLQTFAVSLTDSFASNTPAQPEDQLKLAVKPLLDNVGAQLGYATLLRSESPIEGGRPDFAVDVNGVLCGYIELKAPGLGARPMRLPARDKKQWKKFQSLPNLIYTDGNEWTLFRSGESTFPKTIRLTGDICADGQSAVSPADAAALEVMLRDFLAWEPIVPSKPRELAKLLAPLCRLIRADVQSAIADEESGLSLLAAEWRAALFPDADDAHFADAYAQTLTYGLLLARIEGQDELTLSSAAKALEENHNLLAVALRVLG